MLPVVVESTTIKPKKQQDYMSVTAYSLAKRKKGGGKMSEERKN